MDSGETGGALYREMIASDEYWEGPVNRPFSRDGMSYEEKQIYHNEIGGILNNDAEVQRIGNLVLSLRAGCTSTEVPTGEALIAPQSNPRQILQVVLDHREIVSKTKLNYSRNKRYDRELYNFQLANPARLEKFESTCQRMGRPEIGMKRTLALAYMPHGKRKIATLQRTVEYVRGVNDSAKMALALCSVFIDENEVLPVARPGVMPLVEVGGIYKNVIQNKLSKIISATLVEPTSVLWNSHGQSGSRQGSRKRRTGLQAALKWATQ